MDFEEKIRRHCRCGACGGKIGRRINLMELDRAACWEYPTAGNVITGESGKAVAVLCDRCIKDNAAPREAVEFRGEAEIVYHPVAELPAWRPAARTIRWFRTSPNEGEDCLCSWCGQPIVCPDDSDLDDGSDPREWPAIRMWDERGEEEARFHPRCLDEAIQAGQIQVGGDKRS